ncbi:hypothetical protein X566_21540 [Afipia sp. P52-10]|jgi:hypothetical protein|uniref:hypothetical protein n=1 Tax=Afipia sp. P52-10 TaxID=1429916 RepID=UPI0003DF0B4C|nr:hypothetical protein [Afipia sp. P52-10]ETR75943.1 hypothetical protein X566_21540 [Afipia sp. P52-10]
MPEPSHRGRYHTLIALGAAAAVAAALAYIAHDYLGFSRADIRQDALTGASAIFAFLLMCTFIGGEAEQ